MTATVDVHWSFRSPYSYLATPDMVRLSEEFEVDVRLRVVLPLAVRQADFFGPENMRRVRYILRDAPRRAEMLGLPWVWPDPDPIAQNLETMEIAAEQPLIRRLSALGVEADRRRRGPAFAFRVARLIFGGTRGWDRDEHLGRAAAAAGLDLPAMQDAVETGDHAAEIEANQRALEAAGHWGVPTFVFDGEPFFGQDRVDTLRWRLDKSGVPRRGGTGGA